MVGCVLEEWMKMKDFDAFFEANRDKIVSFAKANTKYNAAGLATISKDEDWYNDDVWEKELRGEKNSERKHSIAANETRTSVVC